MPRHRHRYRYRFTRSLVAVCVFIIAAYIVAYIRYKVNTPEETLAEVQLAHAGLKAEVWAAEPLMENPVAFCFDEAGRCFVAETRRFNADESDTQSHRYWLDDDLANRSIDDMLAMFKKYNFKRTVASDEKVRLLWDSTGRGKADTSVVFANGFNRPQDGVASGVLARKGNVYLACTPDLYLLKDTTGANKADVRQSLLTGFGPALQYLGHELHGLRMGPDGKLYFSMGDRGFVVKTKEGKELRYPNQGAVLRCELDGSNLEVLHAGMRNPQEIAFDDYGNLFNFENDANSGDMPRWVYIVEGGDCGWRGGFQYGTGYHTPAVPQGNRGTWNTEKLWHTHHDGQPAWILPPIANFGIGPAGMTHYPGIGLNDKYKDHFFCCDFTGHPRNSVIWALSVKPKGASFEIANREPFITGMVPTDCEFGPDGAFYWSDWVSGFKPPNMGRIFRVTDPEAMKNPQVAEAKKLIAEGFEKRSIAELVKLLEFPHQLVRQEAQFELAARKPEDATKAFASVLTDSKNQIARLHAVWGLGMLARKHVDAVTSLFIRAVYSEKDVEIKRAAVEQLGNVISYEGPKTNPLAFQIQTAIRTLIGDPDDRVKAAAAVAYGKIGPWELERRPAAEQAHFAPLFDMLKANADKDPYLRHAAVMGLVHLTRNPVDLFNVWTLAKDKYDMPAVRMGVLLALRKLKSEKVSEFLSDTEPAIVAEAARAAYDERLGIGELLAKFAEKPNQPDAIAFRALGANYHLGTSEAACRVASFAARQSEPDYTRAFALRLLSDWEKPPRRDPITGLTLDLPPRDANIASFALLKAGAGVFAGSDTIRKEATQVAARLNIKEFAPIMAALVRDAKNPVNVRVEALLAVDTLKHESAKELAAFALASDEPKLRAAGRNVQAKLDPAAVLKELPALLKDDKTSLAEKQGAFAILATQGDSEEADKLLAEGLDAANAGTLPATLVLDVLEAAETRARIPKLKQKVDTYRGTQAKNPDTLAAYFESLDGGDAERGRNIFLNNAAVSCQRCHKLDGHGGEVGPALNGIAADKDRRYLLESIVLPSAKIAKGYDTVILLLNDDRTVSGIIKSEDKKQIKLVTAENKELVIAVDDVARRRTGPSAMPDDLHKKLSRRELRDVVEFLSSLKDVPKK